MKRNRWTLALLALLAPAGAQAYDVITNGQFETGSLAGWQTHNVYSGPASGSWVINDGSPAPFSGLSTVPPPEGNYEAIADQSGDATTILYQDITIPASAKVTLKFMLGFGNLGPDYFNPSTLDPGNPNNQRVRVDLTTTAASLMTLSTGLLQTVFTTNSGSPAFQGPTPMTADVSSLAGQTVRLRFIVVATAGNLLAGVDDVKLEVSPFAEIASFYGLYTAPAHWGDFDGDGVYDVSSSGGDDISMYWTLYRWTPGFSTWSYFGSLTGLAHGGTTLADVDRDNDLDFAGVGWTNTTPWDFLVYRNDLLGGLTPIPQAGSTPGTRFGSIDFGDYDMDGDLDALITGDRFGIFGDYASTTIENNVGGAEFVNYGASILGVSNGNAVWRDIFRDGMLDVALCGSNSAALFIGDGTLVFANSGGSLPGVVRGAVAAGDLNNDGIDDVVVTGFDGAARIAKVFVYDYNTYGYVELAAGLTGVEESSVSLGDFDNDGWVDIALCGFTGASRVTKVYHNDNGASFTDTDAGIIGVSRGSVEFGDYEGDGDLDLLVQGTTGASAVCLVYSNSVPVANAPPLVPLGPIAFVESDRAQLTYSYYGPDDHTPMSVLTSNFRAGSSPGACDVIAPMSNLTTGRRLVPRAGEAHLTPARYLPFKSFGHGSLYYSVQTVDQAYQGSPWASEERLTIGPELALIQDVPGDQGGKVRLSIDKSLLDDEARTVTPATGYNVWRLVPSAAVARAVAREGRALEPARATARLQGDSVRPGAGPRAEERPATDAAEATDLALIEWNGRTFTHSAGQSIASPFPAGTWEILGSFFATQQPNYVFVASTLADSGSSGPNTESFIVTVHTTTPSMWFASPPASGRSVDNIPPAPPVGLTAAHHTGSGNQLSWQPSAENDFAGFRVYRGTSPGFVADPSTLAASVTNPAWTDPSYDAPIVFYKVSTLDDAGNESAAVPPTTLVATEGTGLPLEFALHAAAPNPSGARMRIGFALPSAQRVRLEVFDAAGRLVRTLVDGELPAGEHEARWHGENASGHRTGAGMFFLRLRAGSFEATRRVVRIE